MHRRSVTWAVALAGCVLTGSAVAALPLGCGDLHNAFGPFDYRVVSAANKDVVEQHHFTAKVEMLRSGETGTYLGPDLDYTLRAMPNHARALMAVAKLSAQKHVEDFGGSYKAECYFERAIRFQPTDPTPHLIYAIYLKDHKRLLEVKEQLAEAQRLRGTPTQFDFDYNLGLLYLGIGDYDGASLAGRRAYALGAPWPALKTRLKAAGKWSDEPPPAPVDDTVDASAGTPSATPPATTPQ